MEIIKMKGVKGKLLKKLKTIKTIGYLSPVVRTPLTQIQEEAKNQPNQNTVPVQDPEAINVSERMKDLDNQEMDFDGDLSDKENIFNPEMKASISDDRSNGYSEKQKAKDAIFEGKDFGVEKKRSVPISEIDVWGFRRPDLDSGTLFDPNLLAAFEQAVMEVKALEAERRSRNQQRTRQGYDEELPPSKTRKIDEPSDPLLEFQEVCPPGGKVSVVLYTTGLRGIRKTFEDCHRIRSLLVNMRVSFFERDVSMHSGFKEELWKILGGKIVPPRLFVKGRYIGGADEVLGLHEQGKLKPLMEGIPTDRNDAPCEGCVGIRFIVCFNCNGSRKILPEGDGAAISCSECNENGLIICPFCSLI